MNLKLKYMFTVLTIGIFTAQQAAQAGNDAEDEKNPPLQNQSVPNGAPQAQENLQQQGFQQDHSVQDKQVWYKTQVERVETKIQEIVQSQKELAVLSERLDKNWTQVETASQTIQARLEECKGNIEKNQQFLEALNVSRQKNKNYLEGLYSEIQKNREIQQSCESEKQDILNTRAARAQAVCVPENQERQQQSQIQEITQSLENIHLEQGVDSGDNQGSALEADKKLQTILEKLQKVLNAQKEEYENIQHRIKKCEDLDSKLQGGLKFYETQDHVLQRLKKELENEALELPEQRKQIQNQYQIFKQNREELKNTQEKFEKIHRQLLDIMIQQGSKRIHDQSQ
ncbi:hypothetical protein [Holospora curviuscula]|uniref:Chromosome partition protein Smc n=1 Tax=Holospora curviuscula TaxID=1082868 RepID=A0A2S5RGE1_9PROT|nr:hypothetical protein [Holospora curviuscula]PPE06361.1 Chromosome partition protein Smc [Holospora curviuscula]